MKQEKNVGIGRLAIAIALKKRALYVRIFKHSEKLAHVGAGRE